MAWRIVGPPVTTAVAAAAIRETGGASAPRGARSLQAWGSSRKSGTGRILRENAVVPASGDAYASSHARYQGVPRSGADVAYCLRAAHPRMSLDRPAFRVRHGRTIARLYDASEAKRWRVTADAFESTLHGSVTHRFPDGTPAADVERYLDTLHVNELALACACRAGDEPAWEHFIREYRPSLYAAARAIANDEGRDLADGLYAELFGLAERDGERRSLLADTTDAAA